MKFLKITLRHAGTQYFSRIRNVLIIALILPLTIVAEEERGSINQPKKVVQEKGAVMVLPAYQGTGIGGKIAYMPEWKAFGWFQANDRVEWDLEIDKAGDYEVFLEWSVSDEESGKAFLLSVGSADLEGIVDKSGSWETFRTKSMGQIKLVSGNQKVIFKPLKDFGEGYFLDLRSIRLAPVEPK